MASKGVPRPNELAEEDAVLQGSVKWSIKQADRSDGTVLLSHKETTIPVALRALRYCPCGRLVLGDPPCYVCHAPAPQRPAADGGEEHG